MSTALIPQIGSPSQLIVDPAPSSQIGNKRQNDDDDIEEQCTKKIKTSHTWSESLKQLGNSTRLSTPPPTAATVSAATTPLSIASTSQPTGSKASLEPRRSRRIHETVDYVEIIQIDSADSSTDESVVEVPPAETVTKSNSKVLKTSKSSAVKTRAKGSKNVSKLKPKPDRRTRSKPAAKRTSLIVVLKINEDALERTLNPSVQPVIAQATESFMRDSLENEIDHDMVNAAMALLQLSQQGPPVTPLKSVLTEYFRENRLRK